MEQKAKEAASHAAIPVSISAMLVTLGVVYGDIGTSPMYVTKALVAGNGGRRYRPHRGCRRAAR